ncbi:MAG TPA: carboxyl transferase domain-containing protein [Candidatus Aminicenantes bacterium]|nr:carboxyl transferase domain-containing protein [Candidatus Aminicenantes bacterium]
MKNLIKDLIEFRKNRDEAGGADKLAKRRQNGKMTARDRLEYLFDPGTFVELQGYIQHRSENFDLGKKKYLGDGVVTGFGRVHDRLVYAYSQDFTVLGGSLGEMHAKKICNVMDLALKAGAPMVGINDSGGARIQEGISSLAGYGDIFFRNTLSSGVIPQISVIMGPCAGGAVYSPGITDFVFQVANSSYMFVTGPEVIKAVNKEDVTFEDLGGASQHASISGVTHFIGTDEPGTLDMVKELLSYIPSNNTEPPPPGPIADPYDRMDERLNDIVPVNPNKPYDIKELIPLVVDDGKFFEVHKNFAPNLVVCFARLGGRTVGLIANNPAAFAGTLDINASDKGARFIRFCDAFNIPLVTIVDVPGFLPGKDQEMMGIIRHGAKLLYAYSEATVPKLTVITRKAYGGAYIVMSSKHLGADMVYAWPTAEIAVMGAAGAINIIFRKDIQEAVEPETVRERLVNEYKEKFAHPRMSASLGYIDDIILPTETRPMLIKALESLENKAMSSPKKKHGNIPL